MARIEWPTIVLALACTAGWFALVYAIGAAGYWWLWPLLPLVLTLHSSLQHEALHGHPTRNRLVNEALVLLPVGLAYPYRRFRGLHLKHHNDENLTDPFEDPETNYMSPEQWARAGRFWRTVRVLNNTQLGRLAIGPALSVAGFAKGEFRELAAGNRAVMFAWLQQIAGYAVVFSWVSWVCGIHPLLYIFGAAYPALSLLSVRTFIEHQALEDKEKRTIVNEDRGFFAFLFLNNSLHFVHHNHPTVPWYELPALYAEKRDAFLAENGGYVMRNYWEVFSRYGLRPKEPVEHPVMKAGRWTVGGPRPPATL
jgi:fatty acid desaturase